MVRDTESRLSALRAALVDNGLDGFIMMTGDEHISEFVAAYSQRVAWLSGFTGSTGKVAVLVDRAAIFVDARYSSIVREQVDPAHWQYADEPETNIAEWLTQNAAAGSRIGYDARLYTRGAIQAIEQKLGDRVVLVPLQRNPVDPLWPDQPARPVTPAFIQPDALAGKSSGAKRADVTSWLHSIGADACVLVALDSIAWLFNLRGSDNPIAPINFAYAVCHSDGTADLFIDLAKIDAAVREHLADDVRIVPYDRFYGALEAFEGKLVAVDPARTPAAIYDALAAGGARAVDHRDPTILPKATKNEAEIDGFRRAHVLDGAALTRFLHWFAKEAPKGELTELSAAAKLTNFRREIGELHGLSFEPVSAADGNAAMPHYSASADSNAPIRPDGIYLVDSGGQYPSGTTDVTRTVAVGKASAEFRNRFTLVLKAHIALDTAAFPPGTLGSQLDAIARAPLWASGIECAHGIGHGVGHFLNVHEGPVYIARARPEEVPVQAGMVLSNEPGYYKADQFGIRTENLVVVVDKPVDGAVMPMLGFETLTMAPIDREVIDLQMLTSAELDWVDRYHATVFERLSPLLAAEERHWLEHRTAPLAS
ncbi:aminopeptidase P family protein [Sphingomonas mali]|uniref:aminopeptidase P family protein n=1 Tax=Sphingomonas mali TaxID=40682 RepID=UPI0008372E04|nr:aminopeptidase P family protein [Sphingomonas mali]